jgi:hypothetical protein
VWLSKKLAQSVNGIDLTKRTVGDVLELSPREAWLLLAEGYAQLDRRVTRERRAVPRSGVCRDRRRRLTS